MNLLSLGLSFRNTPVEIREKVAFSQDKLESAVSDLSARYGCETVILNTCNRVEVYLAKPATSELPATDVITEMLAEYHHVSQGQLHSYLIPRHNTESIKHLFRVAGSLDSLIVGEGQIAGQVRDAFELALKLGTSGPLLNALFQYAQRVAKRVRTETGITEGHVSVSSVAVDYVKQVFDSFHDKTVLIIGAGKMGRLTLKHLQELNPKHILVTNRSLPRAEELASLCSGQAVDWSKLDDALVQADIVISTTGATELIMTAARYRPIRKQKGYRTTVILDIAVPRDFDPAIHDGERNFLFNIDDLKSVCQQTMDKRKSHLLKAEQIVDDEVKKFLDEWSRRKNGQLIAQLTQEFEAKRQEVLNPLLGRLNGKISDQERKEIEYAFRLFQNKLLHGPISAIAESTRDGSGHAVLDLIRKMFKLDGLPDHK